MKINTLLSQLELEPSNQEILKVKKKTTDLISLIRQEIKKEKIAAEIFVGGSYAKGTLTKKKAYDIDIFIRFNWKYEDISHFLGNLLLSVCKKVNLKLKRIHGSRDYFQAISGNIIFELIPVIKIKNPKEARNVTDLSYFHVNYLKKKLNPKLRKEIIAAKTFFHAQRVYGAESYIRGFSGYALECLIIYYKSFEKMLKELIKVKDRLIIDPEKKYKNKDEILLTMNESRLQSPLIIVDPTWKERNVTAALSRETFFKLQETARKLLKNPSKDYFIEKPLNISKLISLAKSKKAHFVSIILETDKQEGDIAGTKLKKFSEFLSSELSRFYEIIKTEFEYNDKKTANFYLVAKPKSSIMRLGPPLSLESHVIAFKKANKNTFIKNNFIHAKLNFKIPIKTFLETWKKKNQNKIHEMHITSLKIK